MTAMHKPTCATRVARVTFDDHRYFGFGALTELVGQEDYVGVMSMAVTGHRAPPEVRAFLDDASVIISAADPRIWPLKITRLVASYGSWMASFVAGQLCTEGNKIGQPTAEYDARQLVDVHEAAGRDVEDAPRLQRAAEAFVAGAPRLVGYGIAFRRFDERLVALVPLVEARGLTRRPFWRVQEALSAAAMKLRKLPPNIVTGLAAVLLDDGYTPAQIGALLSFLNLNCYAANAFEGAEHPSAELRALPEDRVEYVGRAPRSTGRTPRS